MGLFMSKEEWEATRERQASVQDSHRPETHWDSLGQGESRPPPRLSISSLLAIRQRLAACRWIFALHCHATIIEEVSRFWLIRSLNYSGSRRPCDRFSGIGLPNVKIGAAVPVFDRLSEVNRY